MDSIALYDRYVNTSKDNERKKHIRDFLWPILLNPRKRINSDMAVTLPWSDGRLVREIIEEAGPLLPTNPRSHSGIGWAITEWRLPVWPDWGRIFIRNSHNCTLSETYYAVLEKQGPLAARQQICERCVSSRKGNHCRFKSQRSIKGLRLLQGGVIFDGDFAKSLAVLVVEGVIQPAKGRVVMLDSIHKTALLPAYEDVRRLLLTMVTIAEGLGETGETLEDEELLDRLLDMKVEIGDISTDWGEPYLTANGTAKVVSWDIPTADEARSLPLRFVQDMLAILQKKTTEYEEARLELSGNGLAIYMRKGYLRHLMKKTKNNTIIFLGPSLDMLRKAEDRGWRIVDPFDLPDEKPKSLKTGDRVYSILEALWEGGQCATQKALAEASGEDKSTVSRLVRRWEKDGEVRIVPGKRLKGGVQNLLYPPEISVEKAA